MNMPTTDAKADATSHDLVKKQIFVKTTPERAFEVGLEWLLSGAAAALGEA